MGTTNDVLTRALRRIDKLEAARRRVERTLSRCTPGSVLAEDFARQRDELDGQITYLRGVVRRAEAEGLRAWTRQDFAPGDFIEYRGLWFEVLRVNPKSVTVPHPHAPNADRVLNVVRRGAADIHWRWTVGYHDEITGRMSAQEMAERLEDCLRVRSPGDDEGPRDHGE